MIRFVVFFQLFALCFFAMLKTNGLEAVTFGIASVVSAFYAAVAYIREARSSR